MNIDTYFLNIRDLIIDEQKLTINQYNKILNYKFHNDQLRAFGSIILQNYFSKKYNGIIERNQWNKPYFINVPIHFNISHDGDLVVGVVSDRDIGIDIMETKEIDFDKFVSYFSEYEWKNINKNVLTNFYIYWSMKEAYIKAIGKGLYIELNSIEFRGNINITDKFTILPVTVYENGIEQNVVLYGRLIDNYVTVICKLTDTIEPITSISFST